MVMHLNVGYFASVGGKAAQEDRLVCIPDMSTVPGLLEIVVPPEKKISYFAVFDGHGGSRCSSFLAAEFHVELARHKKIASQPITALRETWKGMDELFYRNCMKEVGGDEMAIVSDGSTATVALVVGDELYMLNCGDSAGGVITTEGKIVFMTEDHGTHNPIEAVRVVSNGGMLREQGVTFRRPFPCCCFSTARQAKQRLYPGGLLVTRSFGDFNAKINVLGGIKGVVIHDHGEVKYKKLDHGVKSIILASDGLWDGLMLMQIEDILQGKR